MWGDTQVLMGDGTTKALAEIRTGDEIYGTVRRGWYRRYVRTRVLAHWKTHKPAYRITLEDGTELIASGDHRFLTDRGWKYVTGTGHGPGRRPHLTTNDELRGVGGVAIGVKQQQPYETGYLCGMIRGDGHLATHSYTRSSGRLAQLHQFRLALVDMEGIDRTVSCLQHFGLNPGRFRFKNGNGVTPELSAIRLQRRQEVDRVRGLVAWPSAESTDWSKGFLAGIFDAEGSYSGGVLRISNTDPMIIDVTARSLHRLGFNLAREHIKERPGKPITVIRLLGGLKEHLRFFHTVDPAILRKRNIEGQAVKSSAPLRVGAIEPLRSVLPLFDITTGTGDFIANGVISHNCYARPAHAYVNLSPGLDFETRLFYKADAARLLEEELARPGYVCKAINFGANTDPYQPIERDLKVTRSLLEVLQRFRHPLTIVTKSALVERDIDILSDMARDALVSVFLSVTTLDAGLKRALEPRAPAPVARLGAMRKLNEAGIPVGVLVAPVIPAVNDHEIEAILEACAAAGARSASYVMLRLPYEVKTLFREWLTNHVPERAEHVMSLIRGMREGKENDPRFGSRMHASGSYAELIAQRFKVCSRRLGLDQGRGFQLSTAYFQARRAAGGQLDLL
jgi:DNA repair photolyase